MLIVSRQEWGARPPKSRSTFVLPKRDVWLHHTAGSEPDGAVGIRQIQRFHQDSRGWADVGYSFLIDRTGVIFEGRGAGVVGAHTQGRNSTSHAICIVGNYESVHHPTEESLNAVAWLLRHGVTEGWWPAAALAGGHRDVASTACPGKNLYPKIGAINELAKGDDMPSLDEIRAVVREEINAKVVASEWQFHKPRYAEVLKAIKAVASGSADAERIVDEIAERLARQGPDA